MRNKQEIMEFSGETRTCTGPCGQTKPIEEFHWRLKKDGTRYHQCKICWAERTEKWRKDNPEKFNAAHEQRRVDGRRRRYRLKGLLKGFGISLEWYDEQMKRQHGKCACCGCVLDEINPAGKPGRGGHMWPTIPCIHHSHSHGDVYDILCNGCNVAEGHMRTPARAFKLFQYMQRDALFYASKTTIPQDQPQQI